MEISLGAKVVSSDGKEVGKVDRLILDPETQAIDSLVVHKGILLTEDRIVDMSSIKRIEDDGTVHVNVADSAFDDLPLFVETAYRIPTADEYQTLPYPVDTMVVGTGVQSPLLWNTPAGRTRIGGTVVDEQPVAESSVPEDMVTIDKGTTVYDRYGDSIGQVDDVLYDDYGRLTSIIVKSGLIRKHEYQVPIHRVDKMLDTEIWLNVKESDLSERS